MPASIEADRWLPQYPHRGRGQAVGAEEPAADSAAKWSARKQRARKLSPPCSLTLLAEFSDSETRS